MYANICCTNYRWRGNVYLSCMSKPQRGGDITIVVTMTVAGSKQRK